MLRSILAAWSPFFTMLELVRRDTRDLGVVQGVSLVVEDHRQVGEIGRAQTLAQGSQLLCDDLVEHHHGDLKGVVEGLAGLHDPGGHEPRLPVADLKGNVTGADGALVRDAAKSRLRPESVRGEPGSISRTFRMLADRTLAASSSATNLCFGGARRV